MIGLQQDPPAGPWGQRSAPGSEALAPPRGDRCPAGPVLGLIACILVHSQPCFPGVVIGVDTITLCFPLCCRCRARVLFPLQLQAGEPDGACCAANLRKDSKGHSGSPGSRAVMCYVQCSLCPQLCPFWCSAGPGAAQAEAVPAPAPCC